MNTIKILATSVLSFILFSCTGQGQKQTTTVNPSSSKIEVIDFHSTHRCMTCNAIEKNTKYTLDTYFAQELKEGKITFQTINIDEDENEMIAEKFEASGTALFLNIIKDGKESHVNLTDFAFMNGNDQDKFSLELKRKIDAKLKKL